MESGEISLLNEESETGWKEESDAFYFDDEPLDRILYGKDGESPSQANLFLPGRRLLRKLNSIDGERKIAEIIIIAAEMARDDVLLSLETCREAADILGKVFPYYPCPAIKENILSLRPLFEKIWRVAMEAGDRSLKEIGGQLLFRCCEYQEEYEDARQVLSHLLEIRREKGDRVNEAVALNNFAFEYLLEERWQEAMPIFEESASIFEETQINFERANARANYWICRFALNDMGDIEKTEAELKEIAGTFKGSGRWHERKPLILQARLEEQRGNIENAIQLVKKAIASAGESGTRYPEIDREYLGELMKKRKMRWEKQPGKRRENHENIIG